MESSSEATNCNWTEAVEDLVHAGEIDKAISFLESTISNLEKDKPNNDKKISTSLIDDQLSTVFLDLSKLYSIKGLSLKADQALSRALQIKHQIGGLHIAKDSTRDGYSDHKSRNEVSTADGIAEDDWEAIADRAPDELLSPPCLPGVSNLSLEDSTIKSTKQRGRGTFSYKKHGLYSDYMSDGPIIDDSEDSATHDAKNMETRNLEYGTHHVLVLADFPPSTRTTDLEKVFEKFKDRFVIRWVNDTVALAVFKTPSAALEVRNSIQCPFTVRVLDADDEILSSIPPKDLEPPRPRPRTSTRTAQRMIAQGMGIKLPPNFESSEFRKQEDARRNRIVSRQNMRDDAWGDDS